MLEHGRDQAAGLRQLMARPVPNLLAFPLAAGADAAWVAALARALQGLDRQPLVLDAAGGALAQAFGVRPRHDLLELLQGRRGFEVVARRCADDIPLLRAERGVEAFVASGAPGQGLLAALVRLAPRFDDLLLAMPGTELASVAGPETTTPVIGLPATPQGAVQAYAQLKELAEDFGYRRFACVALGVASEAQAAQEHARLAATAGRFLQSEVALAGWLPRAGSAPGAGLARLARALLPPVPAESGTPCLA